MDKNVLPLLRPWPTAKRKKSIKFFVAAVVPLTNSEAEPKSIKFLFSLHSLESAKLYFFTTKHKQLSL
jgi:hypothetical protein